MLRHFYGSILELWQEGIKAEQREKKEINCRNK